MIDASNVVQIQGRLTRDAEEVMDGKMLRFSIAVDRAGYEKGSDNNAGFFNCKIWMTENDYTASGVIKNIRTVYDTGRLSKGAMVRVVGSLNQDRYVDSDGNKRESTGITVETIESYARSADSESNQSSASESDSKPAEATQSAVKAF